MIKAEGFRVFWRGFVPAYVLAVGMIVVVAIYFVADCVLLLFPFLCVAGMSSLPPTPSSRLWCWKSCQCSLALVRLCETVDGPKVWFSFLGTPCNVKINCNLFDLINWLVESRVRATLQCCGDTLVWCTCAEMSIISNICVG